ncbi:helix-turn-helix domain-containing protein [Mesorhizobium sp. M0701]|uniref:helix-turn-helix domain-containing protein n=2 Tax=Mesorhizobium TaxID=68287 RepID=UPI003337B750
MNIPTVRTTHWRYADALRSQYPKLAVDHASLYRSHGRVFTSAGSAAGIDLLIEIVRQDFGADAANSVARRLIMPAHRTGGQAQFLERPVPTRRGSEVAPLLDKMRAELGGVWTLERMASECHMSLRTFIRRFTQATASPPGEWLVSERLDEAKQLLIGRHHSIEEIAAARGHEFSGYAATSLPQTQGYQPKGVSNAVRPSDASLIMILTNARSSICAINVRKGVAERTRSHGRARVSRLAHRR